MNPSKHIKNIKKFIVKKYGKNLAALLIFGSVVYSAYKEGKSDIDTIILLKTKKDLDLEEERKILIKCLKKEKFANQYFDDLKGVKNYIKRRKNWITWITITYKGGALTLYSTPEFRNFKKWMKKHPNRKKDLKEHIKEKDKFELDGYFKKIKGFDLTKGLLGNLRRKVQVLNYLNTNKIIFDYGKCIKNIDLEEKNKIELRKLWEFYKRRKGLLKKKKQEYYTISRILTKKILEAN